LPAARGDILVRLVMDLPIRCTLTRRMVQRPPDSEDPTSEEEAIEFDGTHTDQLDDTYRLRVVTASEGGKARAANHCCRLSRKKTTALDAIGLDLGQ
jgi:hypothetical protein